MTIYAYPFVGQANTEAECSRLFSEFQDSGVADDSPTAFLVTSDGTGMYVDVQPGFAILRGYAVVNTAPIRVNLVAPDSSDRTDRIVIRIDPATDSGTVAALKGTPGLGAPAITKTETGIYEISCGRVPVPTGVPYIPTGAPVDERPFLGRRIGRWSTDSRPTDPRKNTLGYNTSTNRWEYYTGSGIWADLAPSIAWGAVIDKPTVFAPATHSHDWAEITGKPLTYTPTTHTHSWSQVDSKPTTFPPSAHSHGWTEVTGKPATFPPDTHSHSYAPVGHNHDATYSNITHLHEWTDKANWAFRSDGSDRPHNYGPAGGTYYAVWVDGNHNFCRNTSSRRYKQNIRDVSFDPDRVLSLRPRKFDRIPPEGETEAPQNELGLIAEEVNEHVPELVIWDNGRIESVRYDLLPVVMLDVLRDQARRIADLEARIASLENGR